MANLFGHMELNTSDAKVAKKFYKKLFKSWELTDMPTPSGTYTVIDVGAHGPAKKSAAGGGIMQIPVPDAPTTGWVPYVEVENVTKSLTQAAKLGAKIVMPCEDIGMGTIGIFVDPTGIACGVWAPAPKKASAKKKGKKKNKK